MSSSPAPQPESGAGEELATLICRVCGSSAFDEDSPHEFAGGLTERLICEVCGAHRIL